MQDFSICDFGKGKRNEKRIVNYSSSVNISPDWTNWNHNKTFAFFASHGDCAHPHAGEPTPSSTDTRSVTVQSTGCISVRRNKRPHWCRLTSIQPTAQGFIDLPLRAITLLAGFMIAESALIGRRIGLFASFISIITTWAVSPTFSRTQMNLSDSIVSVLNDIEFVLMPTFVSWKKKKKKEKKLWFKLHSISQIQFNGCGWNRLGELGNRAINAETPIDRAYGRHLDLLQQGHLRKLGQKCWHFVDEQLFVDFSKRQLWKSQQFCKHRVAGAMFNKCESRAFEWNACMHDCTGWAEGGTDVLFRLITQDDALN